MNEQVRHAEHGVFRVFADLHVHNAAVLLRHHAVQRQRDGDPLIVLDAAVIVRVQEGEIVGLVQRVLLHVQARAVDVRAQDVHALGERAGAQLHQNDGLAAHGCPHLVAWSKFATCGDSVVQAFVARGLGAADGRSGKLALGFVLGNEIDVACTKLLKLGKLVFVVALPRRLAFHTRSSRSGLSFADDTTPTAPAAPARDGAVVVRIPEGYRFHAFGEGGDWKLDAGGIIGKIISLKTALRDAPCSARRLREAQL